MEAVRRAVIDIGTNSIKLLVAEVSPQEVVPLLEESKQTRLGRGFYQTHRLQPEAIAATVAAVAKFSGLAHSQQAQTIRVIATSAARDALNAAELTDAIHAACGLETEIISGDQEADWVFQGVTTDSALAHEPLLLLDVGGGSTEFILGQGHNKHFRHSFPLGTVRLMEKFPRSDPPQPEDLSVCRAWLKQFLQSEVRPKLEPALKHEEALGSSRRSVQLVGTGGTTSILARMESRLESYDRQIIEATRLSLNRLHWHVQHLWSLPLHEREQLVGLPKNRADVILIGAVIYEGILEEFGFPELRISTRGLRFAAVMNQ
jgi:exopolyphosphatase/guanosine-5'-triphosphate,3'-diphosphate pyrophosphatase